MFGLYYHFVLSVCFNFTASVKSKAVLYTLLYNSTITFEVKQSDEAFDGLPLNSLESTYLGCPTPQNLSYLMREPSFPNFGLSESLSEIFCHYSAIVE